MKTSTDRILTTHVGSLPRPETLLPLLRARHLEEDYDAAEFRAAVTQAVRDAVAWQVELGIDVVNDGEMSKISYASYVKDRVDGMSSGAADSREPLAPTRNPDIGAHPDWAQGFAGRVTGPQTVLPPVCTGPLSYTGEDQLNFDLANLGDAVKAAGASEAFMTAVSPGTVPLFARDVYFKDLEKWVEAMGAAMQPEYEAIHQAGFVLQLDCPDLGAGRHFYARDFSDHEFAKVAEAHIDVINHATRNIPPDAMRLHICWGNYPGPHEHDFPVSQLIPALNKARPRALLFEGANPAHDHEWEDWRAAKLDDDKILIPGVVDSTANFVEHPRLIAQRICRYVEIVGRERVIAGTDCGFGTWAGTPQVFPTVVASKFRNMAEGARLATEKLWNGRG